MTGPNIVVVMVDDMSERMLYDLPKVTELVVDAGATAPNYLMSQPVCAPSRATFLRGQYAQNTGIHVNRDGDVYALDIFRDTGLEASTLATWFQDAAYRTGLVGKYMNGYGETLITPEYYTPPGWDYFVGVGGDAGDAQNYWLYDNGTMVYHGTGDEHYLTSVLSEAACGFLQNALTDQVPFFLVVTPKAPHHPADFHSQYADHYTSVTYPTGSANLSFNEISVNDKPDWIRHQVSVDSHEQSRIHHYFQRKLRAMRSVDDLVGELIAEIGPTAMANTYFVFCTDNGFHSGEHRLGHGNAFGGKNTIYEEDIRVPLYIRGPGIAANSTVTELIGNVDLAPTLCDLAGVIPDPGVVLDGRSFAPLVKGQTVPEWRKYFLLTRLEGGHRNAGFRAEYIDPVDGLTKFTFGEYVDQQELNQGEYYNLNTDPAQLANGYNDLHPDTRGDYQIRLADLRDCEGASCRAAEV